MTETTPPKPRFAPLVDQDGVAVPARDMPQRPPTLDWHAAFPGGGLDDAGDLPTSGFGGRKRRAGAAASGRDEPVLTVDARLMRDLALKVVAAGKAGLVKAGLAGVQHQDGTTTIARSLCACLASQCGRRVVLIEANTRSPSLRASLGLADGPGLGDVLAKAASLESALRLSRAAGTMLLLPAGGQMPAGEALARAVDQLAADLFQYADTLVFDLPPVLGYPDAGLAARSLDGVGLVMRARRTTSKDAEQAASVLAGVGVPVLGAVLNRHRG